jgi:DNA-binding MarR family transcriptional regulator
MNKTIQQITGLAFNLHHLMKRKVMEEADFSGDMSMLHLETLCIVSSQQGITMKELASALKISAPSATSLVKRLVDSKLLKRTADPDNRKLVCLQLTASGTKMFTANMAKKQQAIGSVLAVLSKEDQKHMLRIYTTLVDSLS